jgi:hypothetical protein
LQFNGSNLSGQSGNFIRFGALSTENMVLNAGASSGVVDIAGSDLLISSNALFKLGNGTLTAPSRCLISDNFGQLGQNGQCLSVNAAGNVVWQYPKTNIPQILPLSSHSSGENATFFSIRINSAPSFEFADRGTYVISVNIFGSCVYTPLPGDTSPFPLGFELIRKIIFTNTPINQAGAGSNSIDLKSGSNMISMTIVMTIDTTTAAIPATDFERVNLSFGDTDVTRIDSNGDGVAVVGSVALTGTMTIFKQLA